MIGPLIMVDGPVITIKENINSIKSINKLLIDFNWVDIFLKLLYDH